MPKPILAAILFITTILAATVSQAGTLYVPENFRSIQEAVNSAVPYDIIIVNGGIYKENITIEKPLVLRSALGPASTVVQAAIQNKPAIKVSGTMNVSIAGLSATGSTVAGIMLSNSSNVLVTNNHFTNNGIGIILYGSNHNDISGNVSNSNTQYGLYMEKSSGNRVEKNTANLNKDKGFFISYSHENRIIGNSVNLNSWDGIMVFASNGNTLSGNRTLRNTYGLVISESTNNEISENVTIPNLFLILPIVLIYLGVVSYMIQKNILKLVYKER